MDLTDVKLETKVQQLIHPDKKMSENIRIVQNDELNELFNYVDIFAAVYHFMFLQITFDVRMPIGTHCMSKAFRQYVLEWVIMVHHFMRLHITSNYF